MSNNIPPNDENQIGEILKFNWILAAIISKTLKDVILDGNL